jgi:hypothetical protein
LTAETNVGTSVFGTATFFPFDIDISDPESFSSFTVQYLEQGATFPTQASVFVVPSLTLSTTETTTIVNFTIAVSQPDLPPVVSIQAPLGQMGTLGPAISAFSNVAVSNSRVQGEFTLWTGSIDIGTTVTGPVSVAVSDDEENELDILFV